MARWDGWKLVVNVFGNGWARLTPHWRRLCTTCIRCEFFESRVGPKSVSRTSVCRIGRASQICPMTSPTINPPFHLCNEATNYLASTHHSMSLEAWILSLPRIFSIPRIASFQNKSTKSQFECQGIGDMNGFYFPSFTTSRSFYSVLIAVMIPAN